MEFLTQPGLPAPAWGQPAGEMVDQCSVGLGPKHDRLAEGRHAVARCTSRHDQGKGGHSRVKRSCAQHQLGGTLLQVLEADAEPGREPVQSAGFLDIEAQFTFHCLFNQTANRHDAVIM